MPPVTPRAGLRQLQTMGGAGVIVAELTRAVGAQAGRLPVYTTAGRPKASPVGQLIWNKTTSKVEVFTGTEWSAL